MKWLAILFTFFILLVILLADMGVLNRYVGFVYEFPYGDKAGHFILYGLLALFLALALFRARPGLSRRRIAGECGLVLALLIGLEEFSQLFFSSRTFDLVDLTFSYLGVAFFSWAAVQIAK